jgi:uncharacterized protein YprB with RNaseH-like and TPR domain
MLTRTFLHLAGIGLKRERAYWHDGIICWQDLLNDRDLFNHGPSPVLEQQLALSQRKLADGDARWFEDRLGSDSAWRLTPDFDDGRIAYLDIETDGSPGTTLTDGDDGPGGTTVCAVWDGREARVFLRNRDLNELPAYLAKYRVLCTFNGKLFDLPYLESRFGNNFFQGAHLDLRPITRAVGLTGGLKKIEEKVGITRPAAIRRYTGYDAVKLWSAYRQGRAEALEPLARYNLADAVNLQSLLRISYNLAVAQESLPFRHFELWNPGRFQEAIDLAVKRLMNSH